MASLSHLLPLTLLYVSSIARAADTTVAILPFDSHTMDEPLQPLGPALADMLTTDLLGNPGWDLVERARIDAVLAEQQLQQSGAVAPETAAAIGKVLGADWVVTGALSSLDDTLRIDARIVDVQSGVIFAGVSESGPRQRFFALEGDLAKQLLQALGAQPSARQQRALEDERGTLDAAVQIGEARQALAQGDEAAAEALAAEAVALGAPARDVAELQRRGLLSIGYDVSVGVSPEMSGTWGEPAIGLGAELHFGVWPRERLGVVVAAGYRTMAHSDDGFLEESLSEAILGARVRPMVQYSPVRNGQMWAYVGGGLSGFRGVAQQATEDQLLHRRPATSIGALAEVGVQSLPNKRYGSFLALRYVLQPVAINDVAYLARGTHDAGGVELAFGFIGFGGRR